MHREEGRGDGMKGKVSTLQHRHRCPREGGGRAGRGTAHLGVSFRRAMCPSSGSAPASTLVYLRSANKPLAETGAGLNNGKPVNNA